VAINSYFKNLTYAREQDLIEDLTIESIKQYGHDMRYIPRTLVRDDSLFGEDTLSSFDDATELEMYIKNIEGFEGEGEFLSKFNLEVRDTITFTVARKRFDQSLTEKITTEDGYNYLAETANTAAPSRQFLTDSQAGDSLMLDGAGEGYTITSNRPKEGDLLFFPLVQKLYEIKFVEHESVFYQSGRLQTYDLRCELFTYSSEKISTGNTAIDAIETALTTDILAFEYALDDDGTYGEGVLKTEDDGSIMQEYRIEGTQPTANNEYLQSTDSIFSTDAIIDFSEGNPFSEMDRY
jgi:hypothetical protein